MRISLGGSASRAAWRFTGVLCLLAAAWELAAGIDQKDLANSSLEELMNIEVSSVSRKQQKLTETPAAVFVITQEQIRRSGSRSIPEALRLAPGVQVSRIDSSKWAISARGFDGRFANKLLVLIDGRSIYTSLFSGVYWEQNDVMIEDVEQIEVIRGPGASSWGANAVNGVINIITKSAAATQGTLMAVESGNDTPVSAALRHGGKIGPNAHYRMFLKGNKTGEMQQLEGGGAGDGWHQFRSGGRIDWDVSDADSVSVHGDVYQGRSRQNVGLSFPLPGPSINAPVTFSGAYGQARWKHEFQGGSEIAVQTYFMQWNRAESLGSDHQRTVDFDFQHRFRIGKRHEVTWGAGYRRTSDHLTSSAMPNLKALFDPARRADNQWSGFVQDEIALRPDRLTFTAGTKILNNPFSGTELQPSARLMWTPSRKNAFWGSASRAVRTPSRKDQDLATEFQLPINSLITATGVLYGTRDFASEVVISYEAGWRTQLGSRLAVDVAAFHSHYSKLLGNNFGTPVIDMSHGLSVLVPIYQVNGPGATTRGIETSATLSLLRTWKLTATQTWLLLHEHSQAASMLSAKWAIICPRQQYSVHSSWDLTRRLRADIIGTYMDRLVVLSIPSVIRADARLEYDLGQGFTLAVGGQNLLRDRHPEYLPEDHVQYGAVPRSGYLKLTWSFGK